MPRIIKEIVICQSGARHIRKTIIIRTIYVYRHCWYMKSLYGNSFIFKKAEYNKIIVDSTANYLQLVNLYII